MKLKEIIKEEIKRLSEIGEGNLKSYDFKKINHNDYIFQTDDQRYIVEFGTAFFSSFVYWIAYKRISGSYSEDLNDNNQYRIMSTIVNIVKDFVEKNDPISIIFSGTKTKEQLKNGKVIDDQRRNKMYSAYIAKHITSDYELKYLNMGDDGDGYVIRKKLDFIKNNQEYKNYPIIKQIYPELNITKNTINEIGEGNLTPYPYNKINTYNENFEFSFITENRTYEVTFFKNIFLNSYSISFKEQKGKYNQDLNDNNQYKIMSTIIAIVKKVVADTNPISLMFSGYKTKGNDDQRRNNMYCAYVAKHLTSTYELKTFDDEYYYIRKKIDDNIINIYNTFKSDTKDTNKIRILRNIYPELNIKQNTEVINEIGEGNTIPYPFKADGYGEDYTFKTENRNYEVKFNTQPFNRFFLLSFKESLGTYTADLNDNNQYRVMSTLIAIVKDFVNKNNPLGIYFAGSKSKEQLKNGKAVDDQRRNKMYFAYIAKHLTSKFELKIIDADHYAIRKKYSNEIKKIYESNKSRKLDHYNDELIILYPELDINSDSYKNPSKFDFFKSKFNK